MQPLSRKYSARFVCVTGSEYDLILEPGAVYRIGYPSMTA